MRRTTPIAAMLLGIAALGASYAEAQPAAVTVVEPGDLRWQPLDPARPGGPQIAVVAGDPARPGPFVLRARFVAGSEVRAHTHSSTEYVTVLSGSMRMSAGPRPDQNTARRLGPGGFFIVPANQAHSVWFDADTVLELHAEGPFDQREVAAR